MVLGHSNKPTQATLEKELFQPISSSFHIHMTHVLHKEYGIQAPYSMIQSSPAFTKRKAKKKAQYEVKSDKQFCESFNGTKCL